MEICTEASFRITNFDAYTDTDKDIFKVLYFGRGSISEGVGLCVAERNECFACD